MFNWMKKSLDEVAALPVIPVVEKPEPIIGEPVLSMAEAMKDTTQWKLCKSEPYKKRYYELTHLKSGLQINFTYVSLYGGDDIWNCTLKWMTQDEWRYIIEAFKGFLKELKRIEDEYQAMENQYEREKFMVFVKESK